MIEDADDPTVLTMPAVGPEEYDDIVAWLITGSLVVEAADKQMRKEGGFIARGMRIAAARIYALEAEIVELKKTARLQ